MPTRIEFDFSGELPPDARREMASSVVHLTMVARQALADEMEKLGMGNVRFDSRIIPERKKAVKVVAG